MPNSAQKSKDGAGGRSAMSTLSDAILIETIKKELRCHHLFENYMLSPSAIKSEWNSVTLHSLRGDERINLTFGRFRFGRN